MSDTATSVDFTSTQQGHKRPDIATAKPACFLHTATAVYALDDDGICCYVTISDTARAQNAAAQNAAAQHAAAQHAAAQGAQRCRGAQYVASLDRQSPEGMLAEPRVGAQALFIGRGTGTRMALLRTAPLTSVEYTVEEPDVLAAPALPPFDMPADMAGYDPRKTRLGMPSVCLP